jgi:hypothetical protein
MLEIQIISIVKYWCTSKGKVDMLTLFLVLPQVAVELSLHMVPVPIGGQLEA